MNEKKKLIPCPSYDIAAIESWLKDMAAEGLLLKENGLGNLIAVFEKGEAKTMTYRFEPSAYILRSDEVLDEANRLAKNDFLEEAGWKNLGIYRSYILYSHEGNAELHTESEIEAPLRYEAARARSIAMLETLVWVVLIVSVLYRRCMSLLIQTGSVILLIAAVFAVLSVFSGIAECVRLYVSSSRLEKGIPFEHEKDWKKHSRFYRTFRIVRLIAVGIACAAVFASLGDEGGAGRIHISECQEDPPFLTVQDLDPQAEYKVHTWLEEFHPRINTVRRWSDPLSIDNWIWQEISSLETADHHWSAAMNITYYDTEYEFVSKQLFKEYERDVKMNADEPITLSGADEITAAVNQDGFIHLVFRKEKKTVYASLNVANAAEGIDMTAEAAQRLIDSVH